MRRLHTPISRPRRTRPRGFTPLEVVLTLGVMFGVFWSFLGLGQQACAVYVQQALCLVGWPLF